LQVLGCDAVIGADCSRYQQKKRVCAEHLRVGRQHGADSTAAASLTVIMATTGAQQTQTPVPFVPSGMQAQQQAAVAAALDQQHSSAMISMPPVIAAQQCLYHLVLSGAGTTLACCR
jgi:hypothetical protein